MTTAADLRTKFWKSLKSDMTLMLGLVGVDEAHARPMTAQFDGESGPIWFFTSTDNALVQALAANRTPSRAIATYASKGHDLFAAIHGQLAVEKDRVVIDRYWNKYVAAWFEGGKDDPKLTMLRFDPAEAEIWLDESTVLAGIKLLLGADPKEEYRDKVAKVRIG